MKKLILAILTALLLLTSCSDYNIYKEEINICRVGDVYFDTLQAAVNYISSQRAISESRTIYLVKNVLRSEYSDSIRKGVTVPATFEGDLKIDFGGYRYDFSSKEEYFFRFLGGDNIEVVNGTSVIYEDSISTEKALIVGTRTVTIDEHLIKDLRNNKQAVEVTDEGKLVLKNTELSGAWVLNGEGEIRKGSYTFDSITGSGDLKIYEGTLEVNHESEEFINNAINSVPEEERGETNKTLVHELIYHEAVPATCVTTGLKEYWSCSVEDCGKLFLDKECTKETTLEELIIPFSNHKLTEVPEKQSTCTERGNKQYWICSNCGKYYQDKDGNTEILDKESVYYDLLAHNMIHKYNEISHWMECSVCGILSAASAHTFGEWKIITPGEAVNICTLEGCAYELNTKNGVWSYFEEVPATCGKDGTKAYWNVIIGGYNLKFNEDKSEILTDITIPSIGNHKPSAKWNYDGKSHYHLCTICNTKLDVTDHTLVVNSDANGHWNECSVCDYQISKGNHTYSSWTIDNSKVGYAIKSCTYNGCTHFVSNENGTWSELIKKEPSCDFGILAHYECVVGDETLYFNETKTSLLSVSDLILSPTGSHTPNLNQWFVGGNPLDAYHYRKCSVCGNIIESLKEEHTFTTKYNESFHYQHCDKCNYSSIISFETHTFNNWIFVDNTHVKGTCSCGYEATFEGVLSTLYPEVPATCTTDGVKAHYDFTITANQEVIHFDSNKSAVIKDLKINKTGHSTLTHKAETDATVSTHGNYEYWYCNKCNIYFKDANAQEQYESVTDTYKHYSLLQKNETLHWYECSICHIQLSIPALHSAVQNFDNTQHWSECAVCGYITSAKVNHSLSSWSLNILGTVASRECSGCNYSETLTGTLTHILNSATCIASGTEEHYKFTSGSTTLYFNTSYSYLANGPSSSPALGHDYQTEWGDHDDTYHYHVCSRCGVKDENTKQTHTITYRATSDGVNHYEVCSVCTYDRSDTLLDHNYGQWVVDIPATGSAEGKRHRECTLCHYTQYEGYRLGNFDISVNSKYITLEGMDIAVVKVGDQYNATVTIPSNVANPTYEWNFGSLSVSNNSNQYTFTCPGVGEYKVSAKVTNNNGFVGYAELIFALKEI